MSFICPIRRGEGPYRVLAPTDVAFTAISDVTAGLTVAVRGENIAIDASTGTVVLNGSSNVTTSDVVASNGLVHVIDAVLLSPSFQSSPLPLSPRGVL